MESGKFPFSAYDFFGYLASGFLALIAADFIVGEKWLLKDSLGLAPVLFWTGAAYITGQVLATPSSWLLEATVVGRWLGKPELILMSPKVRAFKTRLFPGYFKPLPDSIRQKVHEKAKGEGIPDEGIDLFLQALTRVRRVESAGTRLNTFLNLYGFCRNISFTAMGVALAMAAWHLTRHVPGALLLAGISTVVAVGMFYRYLKFFRLFGVEVFLTYSAPPVENVPRGN